MTIKGGLIKLGATIIFLILMIIAGSLMFPGQNLPFSQKGYPPSITPDTPSNHFLFNMLYEKYYIETDKCIRSVLEVPEEYPSPPRPELILFSHTNICSDSYMEPKKDSDPRVVGCTLVIDSDIFDQFYYSKNNFMIFSHRNAYGSLTKRTRYYMIFQVPLNPRTIKHEIFHITLNHYLGDSDGEHSEIYWDTCNVWKGI